MPAASPATLLSAASTHLGLARPALWVLELAGDLILAATTTTLNSPCTELPASES